MSGEDCTGAYDCVAGIHIDGCYSGDSEVDTPQESIDLSAGEAEALSAADFHLRCIGKARHEHTVAAEVYDRELSRIRDLRAEVLGVIERRIEWHEAPVKALHAAILERDATRKTLRLPNGTLKATVNKVVGVEYVDGDAFCKWAEDNDLHTLIHWTVAPDKNAVKKAFEASLDDGIFVAHDGQGSYSVVPGIVPVPPTTKFSVSTQ